MLLLFWWWTGITNGVDIDEWNPAADKHLPSEFSIDDLSGKVGSSLTRCCGF